MLGFSLTLSNCAIHAFVFLYFLFPAPLSCLENILLFHFVTIAFSPPYIKILGRLWENGEGGRGGRRMRKGERRGKARWGCPACTWPTTPITISRPLPPTRRHRSPFYSSCFPVSLPKASLSLFVYLSVCVSLYLSPLFLSFSLTASLELLWLSTYLSICVCVLMYSRLSFSLFSPSHFLLFSHCLLNQKHVAGNSRLQTLFSTLRLPFVQYGKWK